MAVPKRSELANRNHSKLKNSDTQFNYSERSEYLALKYDYDIGLL